ncbi:hypothetical protein HS088_TW07G00889 [Tripterygium wilfordii]|uniref:Protein MIZU-KUSSEI 1-like n=1 Tax=Tripterygium wilfordii TaxID=458696 RepID=A0A7J7DFZ2_TRIWF|nr:protein MIZU-KUSSEI 1 [Tripterygium wilfordii]XP_038707500.1 protein MIZU-KUSSEI 1 [Tripterygium wilfordii]XP_038707501.1 protein MIZU-KUSSEI 1 [Tripterygium wilfordii]KAF5745305.1 hypothetical protein HS088_TW07G00889 [Tripterygium wilfordii]
MKTIMAKTPHDSSFSFSSRYFNWRKKVEDEDEMEENLTFSSSSHFSYEDDRADEFSIPMATNIPSVPAPKKKHQLLTVSKLRWALNIFSRSRSASRSSVGTRMIGTLFGYRRGHVHLAFQENPRLPPAFLIEIATPTSVLVREMASGLVRIALECEKKLEKKGLKLLEEPIWRTYCNGKKCGYATRRECGATEWKVLKAVEPISMGAGVIPGKEGDGVGCEGEVMYMRARFERVVGSKDSEAFYMMNPDGSGGPELSVYLLRV